MAENKTKPTQISVDDFLAAVEPAKRREEAIRLNQLFEGVSGEKGEVWSGSIIGYGRYDYAYASGRTGNWMRTGFSPRKAAHSLYIMSGVERYDDLLSRLGKFKTGASCLYISRLDDVDEEVLRKLIQQSLADMARGSIYYGKPSN